VRIAPAPEAQPDEGSAPDVPTPGGGRIPVLYLAPWIDFGGTDKNTIDWFRRIDRDRFAPSLITTQPSPNRRLGEVADFAEEIWVLPDLMPAEDMPAFILDFIESRGVQVLHLMNSRLGFDLLPDLTCLPHPPGVVVQLHVEEADRSGYVRYVTTRYGNLVDRFSVSNEDLAAAVHEYGIPRDKTRVIYIGVDAEDEFSPQRVEPIAGLAEDRMHVLFPARLTAQKDPLLMVEVAAALKEAGVAFQVHVLGEGELEAEVRERIAARGLADEVPIHPPTPTPQRWYAACDAVLLTSVFEGIPAVVFEAMAMGLPVVAPALPGNVELLGTDYEGLVAGRDSVEGYVSALARIAAQGDGDSPGEAMRARARERFSLERMAADHGELYEEVATERPPATGAPSAPEPVRFLDRPALGTPLVSVLIPHFNQAGFLGECIESIRSQTYPQIETIVIDDASTQRDARALLDELEGAGDVTVVRLSENGGPSHARNVGLESCAGRYVLPVDADNVLLPDAVEKLVEQLSEAGEDVGFIYPNIQFFGNREDYYEVPRYNLYTLIHGNFCDTCSLIDREVFDAGERYAEGIRLGHEDWEFALRLAARGIRGEAAHGPTVRYRKWGFNRSDTVDHSPEQFEQLLAEISPFRGGEAEIKAKESPALSIVPLEPIDLSSVSGRAVAGRLEAQRCLDAELIARFDGSWPASRELPVVRHIPASLATTPFDALRQGLALARGSFVAVSAHDAASLLADPAFTAKVLRRFAAAPGLGAIVLAESAGEGRFFFQPLAEDDLAGAAAHAVIWRRTAEQHMPHGLHADPGDPTASIVRLLSGSGSKVEWRYAPRPAAGEREEPAGWWGELPASRAVAEDPHALHPGAQPLLPGSGAYEVPRWRDTPTWIPPLSALAIRYRERFGERRIVTSGPEPVGYDPEHHMGTLRSTGLAGTARVVRIGDRYRALPRGEWEQLPAGAEEIGYAELAHLPGLDALAVAVHRATKQPLLVTLPDDPILDQVEVIETLGFIDPFPLKPRETPSAQRPDGLLGLTKAADVDRRRHRYAIGSVPQGELLGELGGLAESELGGSIPAWIVDGRLVTDRHRPPQRWFGAAKAARWVAEPAAWRGLTPRSTQAKAILRRSAMAARRLAHPESPGAEAEGPPAAWLFEPDRPGLTPLFASYHPVSDDQLLCRSPEEAAQLGYLAPALLGFLRLVAPQTGELDQRPLAIPWARRFGAVPRSW
jgi:glycosyltransferase involved in cell wall biosynthesis